MSCNEEQIGLYLDGELDEAKARALEAHFSECAKCRDTHELWSKGDERMREAVPPEQWDVLRARVLSKVKAQPWWGIPMGIAAALLVSVLTVFLMTPAPAVETPLVFVEDPETALVSGEAVLHTVMEAEEPTEIAYVCNFIKETEATDQLAEWAEEYKDDPELADAFRMLHAVYMRMKQLPEEPAAWEMLEVQNSLKESDAVDRVNRGRNRIVMRKDP